MILKINDVPTWMLTLVIVGAPIGLPFILTSPGNPGPKARMIALFGPYGDEIGKGIIVVLLAYCWATHLIEFIRRYRAGELF